MSYFLLKGSLLAGKGNKLLLKTNDNKVYLAEVKKKKQDGGFKSEKKLNHHHKEASSHNHEAEGANGDYTDISYEEADSGAGKAKEEKGNESEKITNESEDDDDIIITSSLRKRLAAARKKKKKGNDNSFVGQDFSEDIPSPEWQNVTDTADISV